MGRKDHLLSETVASKAQNLPEGKTVCMQR